MKSTVAKFKPVIPMNADIDTACQVPNLPRTHLLFSLICFQ